MNKPTYRQHFTTKSRGDKVLVILGDKTLTPKYPVRTVFNVYTGKWEQVVLTT